MLEDNTMVRNMKNAAVDTVSKTRERIDDLEDRPIEISKTHFIVFICFKIYLFI